MEFLAIATLLLVILPWSDAQLTAEIPYLESTMGITIKHTTVSLHNNRWLKMINKKEQQAMLNDGVYRIAAGKHARFQASLTYYDHPVGFAELRSDGKWYVYINDIDPLNYSGYTDKTHIGAFRALGSALSALWEQRFNTIAEIECFGCQTMTSS